MLLYPINSHLPEIAIIAPSIPETGGFPVSPIDPSGLGRLSDSIRREAPLRRGQRDRHRRAARSRRRHRRPHPADALRHLAGLPSTQRLKKG